MGKKRLRNRGKPAAFPAWKHSAMPPPGVRPAHLINQKRYELRIRKTIYSKYGLSELQLTEIGALVKLKVLETIRDYTIALYGAESFDVDQEYIEKEDEVLLSFESVDN